MNQILEQIKKPLSSLGLRSEEELRLLFKSLQSLFDEELANVRDPAGLDSLKVRWLGRSDKSIRRQVLDHWLKVESNYRALVGQQFRELLADEGYVATQMTEGFGRIDQIATDSALKVDLSLPGVERVLGSRHILRQTMDELERIFGSLGFSVADGPEIETPYYNFEALNIPEQHPAREMMDTLYFEPGPGAARAGDLLLRTHTSPVQVRTMEKQQPPVRIIVPGKVYRRDNPDATHSYMFTQVEGLAVDTDITFCDFRGTMEHVLREFFGPKVRTKLQPSYFPFTEPSADVYGSCFQCDGKGCRLCKFSGWIELLGAGMVDPAVYGFVNYDAKRLSGFAFGIGVERFAMLKYGVSDIQLFFQNDARFLRQFE